MQNKAAISANATQHEIIQESAERQRQEDKAAKQLERVQAQMAEFLHPAGAAGFRLCRAHERAVFPSGAQAVTTTYGRR